MGKMFYALVFFVASVTGLNLQSAHADSIDENLMRQFKVLQDLYKSPFRHDRIKAEVATGLIAMASSKATDLTLGVTGKLVRRIPERMGGTYALKGLSFGYTVSNYVNVIGWFLLLDGAASWVTDGKIGFVQNFILPAKAATMSEYFMSSQAGFDRFMSLTPESALRYMSFDLELATAVAVMAEAITEQGAN